MEVKLFEEKYRDDMLFMILESKNTLGRIPRLNEDLLNIVGNYISTGNMFWIAIDDNDRVIGSIGTKIISKNEMWLKRLYVKSTMKRQGIGKNIMIKTILTELHQMDDSKFLCAVIVAQYQGKWMFVRQKGKET